jgi:hypothetical protein
VLALMELHAVCRALGKTSACAGSEQAEAARQEGVDDPRLLMLPIKSAAKSRNR